MGSFAIANPGGSAALTDTELRAEPVPVSGPLTDAELRSSAVPADVTDEPGRQLGIVSVAAVCIHIPAITLAANERIRVIAGTAGGAASSRYVSSIGRRAA